LTPATHSYLTEKNFKKRCPAGKLEHKMYGLSELLDIMSPMPVPLHIPKMSKIHALVQISLIEPFVKSTMDVDLKAVIKTSDPIENTCKYQIDNVMGSTTKTEGIDTW
jgi:hypothetical protein